MIVAPLADAARYASLSPRFAEAFEFLRREDLATLESGRHEIDGERLFAIVDRVQGRGQSDSPLEVHRRYIDIQYVVTGDESIGWAPLSACSEPDGDFDTDRDLLFFRDLPRVWVPLHAGEWAIFLPEDAHAPLGGEGELHKVVVKLAI